MRANKMSRGQLAEFINKNYNGVQIFDLMIDFYCKWNAGIADMLLEEDRKIYEKTGTHYMHNILDNFSAFILHRPSYSYWEFINGEHDIYLKRKEADRLIQYFNSICNGFECEWPDNSGITDAIDYLNKWFCHYNEK